MLREFRDFINKENVLDLAIAFTIVFLLGKSKIVVNHFKSRNHLEDMIEFKRRLRII